MPANHLKHVRLQRGIAGYNLFAKKVVTATFEVRNHATSLLNHQGAGCHIPWTKAHFKESVQPSACNVGQIECCGTKSADAMTAP